MKILFEDKNIIVVTKDAGVPSQPDKTGRRDLVSILSEMCKTEIFCVHRLDTATEGILAYAKNSKAAGALTEAVSNGTKKYYAAVRGKAGCGEMRDYLFHDKARNKSFVTDKKRSGVKEAYLEYKTIAENDEISLVEVMLHTGRTHQIRVQFSFRGMPLLGDGKYGSKDKCPMALRCVELSFVHPFTKKEMNFTNYPESPWYTVEFKKGDDSDDKK